MLIHTCVRPAACFLISSRERTSGARASGGSRIFPPIIIRAPPVEQKTSMGGDCEGELLLLLLLYIFILILIYI